MLNYQQQTEEFWNNSLQGWFIKEVYAITIKNINYLVFHHNSTCLLHLKTNNKSFLLTPYSWPYHSNFLVLEFRQQLKEMEENIANIPELILGEIQNKWQESLESSQKKLNHHFKRKEDNWNKIKVCLKEESQRQNNHVIYWYY